MLRKPDKSLEEVIRRYHESAGLIINSTPSHYY